MKRRACAFGFATLLVMMPFAVLASCSSHDMPMVLGDPPGTDSGTTKPKDTGVPIGDAGPCDKLQLLGYVTQAAMMGNPPTPTGGTIADGFYALTKAQEYGTGSSTTFHQSLVVNQGTMHFTKQIKGETTIENLFFTYVLDMPESGVPTSLTATLQTCADGSVTEGGSSTVTFDYTATATELVLAGKVSSGTIVDVFTKQ